MNFNGLDPSHKPSWILCWAIKFKGWRNSKCEPREISASLSQPMKKKKKKETNSLPVPGRDAQDFCHLLSSMAPLKSFACAKKKKKKKEQKSRHVLFNAHWLLTEIVWGVKIRESSEPFHVLLFSRPVTSCKMKLKHRFL